ncbi:histidine kinase [Micromonospora sp. NPDC048843]|uniref:sensor histidine kinase n=1 Tax=Micromonospora sp. NPDC048843 TaxID=3155389 RepID=UPI0034042B0A
MDELTRITGRLRAAGPWAVVRAVLLTVAMASPLIIDSVGEDGPGWIAPLSLVVIVVAFALSRSHPGSTALGALAVSAIDWRLFVAVLVLSYLAGRRRALNLATLGGLAGVLVLGTVVQLLQNLELYTWLVWTAGVIVFGLFPALVGSFRRLQADLVRTGWDQAAQLEREQRVVAEQARLRERARIAQDMHDSLGHELSLIALRAGALELASGLAPEHRAAASELRAGVTTAAERLSEIIGLLRDEEDKAPLRPVHEHIEELVARAVDSGIPVVLCASGEYADVAPMQYRAAYRVVQEALTNAVKHVGATPVEVRLDRHDDEIVVAVRNEPPRQAPAAPPPQGGRGLTGLQERVGLAGGVLRAGPLPDGGFQVVARLPVRPGPVFEEAGPEPAPPTTAAGFRRARSRARRGLVLAFTLPPVLVGALTGTLMALYAHDSLTSRLPPERFRALPIGASRDDVASRLPERQVPERRDEGGPLPPEGSTCEYYRSAAGFVPTPFDVYRLCFRDGRLVTKDVLPPPIR